MAMKTVHNRKEAFSWQKKHDQLAPKLGDIAPDFELKDSKGQNAIRLSDFRGKKPVVLVFGSFT
jgi:peroxiredoxin